ncbi:ubinuclein-2a isoform X3 [Denticeps clupeoides]|uniref:ubinuclein-2a isoform X3 n=1 Tax=Denticeps clupeoides TaxID=299321 RepID=UPI0010A4778F|nr:ubinuclein-2-like isoform X3 [Denticeps clupeoides]
MAEPRKVQFVTLSAFAAGPGAECRKRRLDDVAVLNGDEGFEKPETGAGAAGLFIKTGDIDHDCGVGEVRGVTVRLNLNLAEPSEHSSVEFNYPELVQSLQAKKAPLSQTCLHDPSDPFNDDEREQQHLEALAKKFVNKYGNAAKKKRKDRMQDLIDIGFGYDESDPFIDNSEAYDELVPASLTTKLGGFYINTGTLQFRAASESEGEEGSKEGTSSKVKDGEEQFKKRKRKEGTGLEEKKPRKNRAPKQGVSALNMHRPEKKKRKKLMKDSLSLAAMLRRFTREKEEMHKKNMGPLHPGLTTHHANHMRHNSYTHGNSSSSAVAAGNSNNDISLADLTADPAMISLLSSANESELQDLLSDLDFTMLDANPLTSSPGRENGMMGVGGCLGPKAGGAAMGRGQVAAGMLSPPLLPDGLPAPLTKRIEDLRAASRQFDQEGRKKFFTLDMNNILLDIELQVQEQPVVVRSAIYSHMEAFVPCNKEALLKRLKKLSLNIQSRPLALLQDDRLRTPLLKLKLAVCSVMPEQIARYSMDCMAKTAAKQQSEEVEKNGSEDDDEEKPGKRVMGPRKKFLWDDKLRVLLCNLVRVKLSYYEQEPQCSLSVEDYLKAFMENEVKPLWPKGWMQARMLFKESRAVHGHLTGLGRKKVVPTSKMSKTKVWIHRPGPVVINPAPSPTLAVRPQTASPSEPICLSDSLDEDLAANSLDSISQALALLSNAAKDLAQNNGPLSSSPPVVSGPAPVTHYSSTAVQSLTVKVESPVMTLANVNTLSTSASPSLSSLPASTSGSRPEAFVTMKDIGSLSQAQIHQIAATYRPATGIKSPSPPKPRPPPTALPLLLPQQQKPFNPPMARPGSAAASPTGLAKNSANKPGGIVVNVSQQPRGNSHTPQPPPRVPSSPSPVPSSPSTSSSHTKHKVVSQSSFITPMQVTLTKSPHSSSSPIIKLTPRPPASTPPPSSSQSSSPTVPHARPQVISSPLQYSPKSPAFRPSFSMQSVVAVKPGAGSYSFAGGQKAPLSAGGSATNPSSVSTPPSGTRQENNVSPLANHGQRQRPVGGNTKATAIRCAATTLPSSTSSSHLSQVSSAAGSSLLGSVPPSLPLGFGMLGGLVPVSLPFQLPPLLNFTPPGAPGCSTMGSPPGTNSGYTLAQNLFKSLQSGSQSALPPQLQLSFSDANQSQGGHVKRKSH